MPIDFVEESVPKIDFVPDEQAPSLDRELEREDLRRQMREARAEAYGNKAILGLADLGERAAYTASLMDPLTAVGRVINPRQQSAIPAEAAQAAIDFLDPFGNAPVGSAREGAKQFAAEMVSGLAQPEAVAAMMMGKINPQLPGRLFQPGLIKSSQQAAANLAQAETPAEAVKSGLELGLAIGGTGGIEAHGAKAGKAKPTDLTEPNPEVTEPKPAVEEPLPKPTEPVPAAKEEPKPAEPAPVEAAAPVAETDKPAVSGVDIAPQSVTVPSVNKPTEGLASLQLPYGLTRDEVAAAGGDIKQALENSIRLAEEKSLREEAAMRESGGYSWNTNNKRWGQTWTDYKQDPKTRLYEVVAGLEGTTSGIKIGKFNKEDAARAFANDFRDGKVFALENGKQWETMVDSAHRAKPFKPVEIDVLKSRGRTQGTTPEGQVYNIESLQALYDSGKRISKPTPPPPSPEAQAKPAAAPTEAKTEVGEGNVGAVIPTDRMELIDTISAELESAQKSVDASPLSEKDRPFMWGNLANIRGSLRRGANNAQAPVMSMPIKALQYALSEIRDIKRDAETRHLRQKKTTEPPPPQPSAGIEVKKQGAEGKEASAAKVSSAASRFRPREQVLFETPLRGPSGAKLTAYEWKWQPEEFVDKYGEERTRRVSNWEEAESSADTGRDIVHQFLVELPNGEKRLVSAESVPVLLGFTERGKSSKLPSLVSAAKTLAKLRMKLAATKSQNAEYSNAVEAANQLPLPEITSEPAITSVGRDKGKRWGTVWKMGESHVIQHDELPINAERRDALISTWRSDRVKEMGAKPSYASERDLQNRIDRQQRKLNEITGSQSSIQQITPGPGAQTVGETQPPQIQGMGGATPAEFAKGQGSPTAMKYRLIDQERQKRGLEPLSKPERISDQKTMDKAIAAMDQNPNLPDQLIQELRAKPRAIEDWENHVLLLRKIELREEYHKAAREAMQAYADSVEFPSRLADMAAANARTEFYSKKLTELEEASRVAGSARGRALRALRVMANEDFSLASLEMEKRAANNWRPLTPDERAELIKIADEHKAKSEELQKRLDELEKAQQDKEVGTVLTNLKAEVKRNPVAPTSIDLISGKIRGKLEKDPKADIRFYVRKIARFFVSQGTKERDVLVDQVHGVLSGIIPDLDRRTTMDLISGYGDYSRLPKDTVSVILRDLSGQMQQIAKLEDMMRGEAPLRSGQERRTPSDVERILQKQVEEQKKKGGYTVTDPETQLRTALDAVQKRIENQIKDYQIQIDNKTKLIPNKTKLQYNEAIQNLIKLRDEKKKEFNELFPKPKQTEAERLAAWKERTKERIEEIKAFHAGTKQPKQRPTPVVLDKEALRIRFDLHTIERLWREKLAKEKRDQWTRWQKAKTIPAEVLNVSRALLTSFDFSAPGRQGIIIGLAHPIRAASALRPMFEAWRSEKGAFDAAEQIRNRNNAPLYEIGKLYLAEHGGRLSRQEEAYMSRWAAKIPGIRASERAYVTFLNRLRADSFDSMVEGLTANGTANPPELKAIANFINVATGRGVGLERSGTTLNTVFFAPRYVFSRFQFLAGQPLYKGTAATRKAIAKEYGKFLAGAAVVYALASSAGADVGTDPRSSDFGKIIIGNTRIDPMAGLNQVSTLVGRTVSGETKPLKGRAYPIVGKVPYGKSNLLDVMMNFGRGKLSPAIGTGISLRLGKDVANQPFGVSDLPKSMGVPISWQDMYSAMREEGVPAGIAMGMLSMFGIGVNTYEQQNRR